MNMHAAAINGHSIITTFERDGFHAVCIWCGARATPDFNWDAIAEAINRHLLATYEGNAPSPQPDLEADCVFRAEDVDRVLAWWDTYREHGFPGVTDAALAERIRNAR